MGLKCISFVNSICLNKILTTSLEFSRDKSNCGKKKNISMNTSFISTHNNKVSSKRNSLFILLFKQEDDIPMRGKMVFCYATGNETVRRWGIRILWRLTFVELLIYMFKLCPTCPIYAPPLFIIMWIISPIYSIYLNFLRWHFCSVKTSGNWVEIGTASLLDIPTGYHWDMWILK